jgi:transposase-like protein
MKKKNHTPEQIIQKLRQVEALTAQGQTVAQAVKTIEVSEQTYYRWRREYGQMSKDQLKRLKELETENRRLKKLAREQALDIDILKGVAEGKRLSHEIVCQPRRESAELFATSKMSWA